MSAVTADAVHRSFGGRPVLDGIDFDVAGGEFVSVIGPSGSGKSTLFGLIAGLDAPRFRQRHRRWRTAAPGGGPH